MKQTHYELLWRLYVAPKGRLGNAVQAALLKSSEQVRLRRKLRGADTIILTHSQGKVGSSSMYDALMADNPVPNSVVMHSHVIRSADDPRVRAVRRKITPRRTAYTTQILYPLIRDRVTGSLNFIVISAVRDPIDRAISDFFQNLERYTPDRQYPRPGEHTVEDYLGWFHSTYEVTRGSLWFEEQFNELFGLDFYGTPFDQSSGYLVVESSRVKAGIIRFDRISDSWAEFSERLLGRSVELLRSNEAKTKAYGHVYADFKARLRLDRNLLAEIYSAPHVRYFYTEMERNAAIERWAEE
ncbi:hypothetical protein CEY15_17205 [Dietzia natronolimnaea]|uniref:Sulfotransferase family protein n=1 Tax=Dietzia natronolimnaea TaxID=161920 RepID=A0A2A2WKR4_9ACTN|nr:putative capsular polysaccharide synthesis family protein [Dietzia natronolimnaea]PAY21755.1 hypothetical protein CEY15_17205 [Dietzia natronolimnaea]